MYRDYVIRKRVIDLTMFHKEKLTLNSITR